VPEVLAKHHLPQVLDTARILSYQECSDVIQRSDNCSCMPFESRFTPTDEAGLVRLYFYKNPVAHARIAH
jgi:hypothetical protein